MLTALIATVFALAALAALLFAVVVVGIRNEPRAPLQNHAPGHMAAMSRRVLGVYVTATADDHQPHEIEGR